MDRPRFVLGGHGSVIHALPVPATSAGMTQDGPTRLRPAGLGPAIHALPADARGKEGWVPATSAGITRDGPARLRRLRSWSGFYAFPDPEEGWCLQ